MNKVKPKKYLGQHFLVNEIVAESITDLISDETAKIVEVGPGMGVMTKYICKKHPKHDFRLIVQNIRKNLRLKVAILTHSNDHLRNFVIRQLIVHVRPHVA